MHVYIYIYIYIRTYIAENVSGTKFRSRLSGRSGKGYKDRGTYLTRFRCINSRQGRQQVQTSGIRDTRSRVSRWYRQRHQLQAPGQIPRRCVMHPGRGFSITIGDASRSRIQRAISPRDRRDDRENRDEEPTMFFFSFSFSRRAGGDEGRARGKRGSPWHFPSQLRVRYRDELR